MYIYYLLNTSPIDLQQIVATLVFNVYEVLNLLDSTYCNHIVRVVYAQIYSN